VATKEQDLTRQAVQRDRARADHPGVEPVVIQDDGVSAYKVSVFDRPGGRDLVARIEREEVEAVYTDESRACRVASSRSGGSSSTCASRPAPASLPTGRRFVHGRTRATRSRAHSTR
jgi:hypothetical protein